MNPAKQQQFEIGQHVGFWYTRPDDERSYRSGTVHCVHAWGIVIIDDEQGDFRSFRYDRMG